MWLESFLVAAVAVVLIVSLTHLWTAPRELDPLLAIVPALAGIGAATVLRPLAYGLTAALAAAIIAAVAPTALAAASLTATLIATVISAAASSLHTGQTRQFANVVSAAEAAQRALLRPLPDRLGPLHLGVVYLAAAQDARVGGDLYEAVHTPFGIRLIIGDVRGKGLGAVEIASDVLGMFREVAHEVHTLAELARRLDAGLTRRFGEFEEFVTALFVEIDPDAGRLTIYNCGHPPPMLISGGTVSILEVPAPALPLGLLTLASSSGASRSLSFNPNDHLLLYTDGVTEARDRRRVFYPLDQRLAGFSNGTPAGLLERLRADLIRYAGAPLSDDAAMLLVSAPATWAPATT
jgi:serine phosphatase RsbU (regulator of sigma subunit)